MAKTLNRDEPAMRAVNLRLYIESCWPSEPTPEQDVSIETALTLCTTAVRAYRSNSPNRGEAALRLAEHLMERCGLWEGPDDPVGKHHGYNE